MSELSMGMTDDFEVAIGARRWCASAAHLRRTDVIEVLQARSRRLCLASFGGHRHAPHGDGHRKTGVHAEDARYDPDGCSSSSARSPEIGVNLGATLSERLVAPAAWISRTASARSRDARDCADDVVTSRTGRGPSRPPGEGSPFKAELLEQAQDQLHALENEIGRLRLEKDAFENRLRAAIEEHLSLLDLRKQEKADTDNLRFLRRRSTTDVG
jgi:hypothetical protein